jgi:hypothetical protein
MALEGAYVNNELDKFIESLSKKQLEMLRNNPELLKEFVKEFNRDDSFENVSNVGGKGNSNERGKTLTLNNGHSILGDDKQSGFVNIILMLLFVSFMSGAVLSAIYILFNLGKFTFSL